MKDVELKFFSFLLLTTRSYSLSLWILRSWVKATASSQVDLATQWKDLIHWRDERWRESLWREDLQEMPQLPWQPQEVSIWSEFCKKASANERDITVLSSLYADELNLVASIFDCSLERVHWVLASALKVFGSLEVSKRYLESKQAEDIRTQELSWSREFTPEISDPLFEIKWIASYWSQFMVAEKAVSSFLTKPSSSQESGIKDSSSVSSDNSGHSSNSLVIGFICWKALVSLWQAGLTPSFSSLRSYYDRLKKGQAKDRGPRDVLPRWKELALSINTHAFSFAFLFFVLGTVFLWVSKPQQAEQASEANRNTLSFLPRGSTNWAVWWEGITSDFLRQTTASADQNPGESDRPEASSSEIAGIESTKVASSHQDAKSSRLAEGNKLSGALVHASREPNTAADKPARTSSGSFVWRAHLSVQGNTFDPQAFLARLNEFQATKAGQVELGWKKSKSIYYYHFLTKEKWDQDIATFLKESGSLRFEKASHPRVLEPGQSRWIVEVHVLNQREE